MQQSPTKDWLRKRYPYRVSDKYLRSPREQSRENDIETVYSKIKKDSSSKEIQVTELAAAFKDSGIEMPSSSLKNLIKIGSDSRDASVLELEQLKQITTNEKAKRCKTSLNKDLDFREEVRKVAIDGGEGGVPSSYMPYDLNEMLDYVHFKQQKRENE